MFKIGFIHKAMWTKISWQKTLKDIFWDEKLGNKKEITEKQGDGIIKKIKIRMREW